MEHVLQTDVVLLTFVAGSLIPLLTGLLTKLSASSTLKASLNLALSVGAGVLAAWIQASGGITVVQLATAAITTYMSSQVTYHGLWKPTGIADTLAVSTAGTGLGMNSPVPPTGVPASSQSGAPVAPMGMPPQIPGPGGLPTPPAPPAGA